jgi:hypothetical protein
VHNHHVTPPAPRVVYCGLGQEIAEGLTTDRAQKNMDDALEKLLAVEKTHRLVR